MGLMLYYENNKGMNIDNYGANVALQKQQGHEHKQLHRLMLYCENNKGINIDTNGANVVL